MPLRPHPRYAWQMRRAPVVLALISAVVALASPATASAAHYAPPGKAGATQYFETIPTSGGNVAPPSYNPKPTSGSSGQTAPSPTLATTGAGSRGSKRLSQLGTAGQAAANFAQSTSPATTRSPTSGLENVESNPGGSALGSLMNFITGSDAGGIGILMPVILGLSLLTALGIGAYRVARR